MKNYHLPLLLVILLAGCSTPTGGSIAGALMGAVADGVVAGITGEEPDSTFSDAFSTLGRMQGLQSQANKLGVDLNKIPSDWVPKDAETLATVRLEKRADGIVCYWLGDDHLIWNPSENCWIAED